MAQPLRWLLSLLPLPFKGAFSGFVLPLKGAFEGSVLPLKGAFKGSILPLKGAFKGSILPFKGPFKGSFLGLELAGFRNYRLGNVVSGSEVYDSGGQGFGFEPKSEGDGLILRAGLVDLDGHVGSLEPFWSKAQLFNFWPLMK